MFHRPLHIDTGRLHLSTVYIYYISRCLCVQVHVCIHVAEKNGIGEKNRSFKIILVMHWPSIISYHRPSSGAVPTGIGFVQYLLFYIQIPQPLSNREEPIPRLSGTMCETCPVGVCTLGFQIFDNQ